MVKELEIGSSTNRSDLYESLLPQIEALICDEPNLIANLANVAAAIKQQFGYFWVGFYIVEGNQLVLGPFQGPVACTRISKNKGVCGLAWEQECTQIVDNVNNFPGHIACSSASVSEIVVPIFNSKNKVTLVLDIDSVKMADFGEIDKLYLEQIVKLLVVD